MVRPIQAAVSMPSPINSDLDLISIQGAKPALEPSSIGNGPTSTRVGRTLFSNFLILAVWINCIGTFLYHLTANTQLQNIGNVVAIGTVTVCAIICITGQRFHSSKLIGAFLTIILASSYYFNRGRTDVVDVIKFFEVFIIFAAARECTGTLRVTRLSYGLAFLPLFLILLGGSRIPMQEGWSFFPNTNTAALFYLSLIFVYSVREPRHKLAWQILVCVISGKVGILMASITAMLASGAVRLRGSALLLAIASLLALFVLILSGLIDRQITVISNFADDVLTLGISGIANSNYSDLYKMRGQDLSGYFRIIHWSEIIRFWLNGGLEYWLFGYGGGYTPKFTLLKLVPHNDYLKVLVEFGVFSFIAFIALLARIIFSITNRVQRSLFVVMVIYFATDNLLTNFSSMALLFGFAGLVFEPARKKWVATRPKLLENQTRSAF